MPLGDPNFSQLLCFRRFLDAYWLMLVEPDIIAIPPRTCGLGNCLVRRKRWIISPADALPFVCFGLSPELNINPGEHARALKHGMYAKT